MADLAHVLRHIPASDDPNLLVGSNPADDSAVYRLRDDLALVQTVDFLTPIVDDPFVYGQIAAANALSDVYAVGGTPITALNILAYPAGVLGPDLVASILLGGRETALRAGVTIVGGHTVDDPEPKYGLAVTGLIHPDRVLTAHGARAGDRLVLTKPLGTGTLSTAMKAGVAEVWQIQTAVRWMTALNRDASSAMVAAGAHAATDVTGFGLLGHLLELCRASGVAAVIESGAVPLLPGAVESVRAGHVPGGTGTNLHFVESSLRIDGDVSDSLLQLLADPQTSGGLLIALPPDRLDSLLTPGSRSMIAAEVGEVQDGPPRIVIRG